MIGKYVATIGTEPIKYYDNHTCFSDKLNLVYND